MRRSNLADALSHWQKPIDGFQTSALDFYAAVENAVKEREIPGLKTSRVKFKESGVASAERIYLRVKRRGLFFDIGAAPFGSGYFFSWWMSKSLPSPIWGALFMAAVLVAAIQGSRYLWILLFHVPYLPQLIGNSPLRWNVPFIGYNLYYVLTVLVVIVLFRRLAFKTSIDFDGLVSAVPILGRIYKWSFARDTYYSVDTMLMYQSLVSGIVTETVDKVLTEKGLRELNDDEKKPIMKSFLKKGEPQKWTAKA